jgi:hypothetical protein
MYLTRAVCTVDQIYMDGPPLCRSTFWDLGYRIYRKISTVPYIVDVRIGQLPDKC